METRTFRAHYDGSQIQPDEPLELAPNTELLITVLSAGSDEERQSWTRLSVDGLATVYGENEPEYALNSIREANPEYEGR